MIVSNPKEVDKRIHAFLPSYAILCHRYQCRVGSCGSFAFGRLTGLGVRRSFYDGHGDGGGASSAVATRCTRHGFITGTIAGGGLMCLRLGVAGAEMGAGLLVVCVWWGRGARYRGALRWGSANVHLPIVFMAHVTTDRRLLRT